MTYRVLTAHPGDNIELMIANEALCGRECVIRAPLPGGRTVLWFREKRA